jgi:hypothetical protein
MSDDLASAAIRLAGLDTAAPAGEAELERLLDVVIGPHGPIEFLAFSDALAAGLDGSADREPGFEYRVKGGWVVDLTATGVRAALSAALLAIGLATIGEPGGDLAVEVLAVALPLLVNVRRVRLEESDLHVHLVMRDALRDHAGGHQTAAELYAALPAETRDTLDFPSFLNLLARLTSAGLTNKDEDGRLVILAREDARLHITIE